MVRIASVESRSPAEKAGISPGDLLVALNGAEINDVLDYRFYLSEKKVTLSLSRGGKPYEVTIRKGEYDDVGLGFDTYLMDKKRSCANKCVFCFIDQLPKGMRESLYFKDDDSRLSFLMGNAPAELRAHFPRVTASNDEDGIVHALAALGLIP